MKKLFPFKLSMYLIRNYLFDFIIILFGLLSIIYLFDTVELLRRASNVMHVPLPLIFSMSFYKLPEVGQMIFPFAILFSAIFTFWKLTKRHELVIVRTAGLSVWQFITPIMLCVFMIGLIQIMLINPLSAMMISKYKTLEGEYLENKTSLISLSDQGLWLRQKNEDGHVILHAEKIKMPDWKLENVIVLFFSNQNNFLRRIDAPQSTLDQGKWVFSFPTINKPKAIPETLDLLSMSTDLTINDLENSFVAPETISFWKFRSYIKIMERTGFDTTSLKIFFQRLLSQPLLYMAMVLLAAAVSLRPPRLSGTSILVMMGVLVGFVIFFVSSFMQALGGSQQIPIFLAAWFPAIISFILGVGVLMILEDG